MVAAVVSVPPVLPMSGAEMVWPAGGVKVAGRSMPTDEPDGQADALEEVVEAERRRRAPASTADAVREVLVRHQRRLVDEDVAEAARLEVGLEAHVAELRAQVDVAGVRRAAILVELGWPTSCSVGADAGELRRRQPVEAGPIHRAREVARRRHHRIVAVELEVDRLRRRQALEHRDLQRAAEASPPGSR